jgi:hypothetical protein
MSRLRDLGNKAKTNGDTALLIQTGRAAKKLPSSGG